MNILLYTDTPILAKGFSIVFEKLGIKDLSIENTDRASEVTGLLKNKKFDVLVYCTHNPLIQIFLDLFLLRKDLPVLLVSIIPTVEITKKYYKAGIAGVINFDARIDELVYAVRAVMKKEHYMDEGFKKYLINAKNTPSKKIAPLSKREIEVAKLMVMGQKTKEIGIGLNLKPSTVSTVKSSIYSKLGVKNVLDLEKAMKSIS